MMSALVLYYVDIVLHTMFSGTQTLYIHLKPSSFLQCFLVHIHVETYPKLSSNYFWEDMILFVLALHSSTYVEMSTTSDDVRK